MNLRLLALVALSLVPVRSVPAGDKNAPAPPLSEWPRQGGDPRFRIGLGVQWRSIENISLHISPQANLRRFGRFVPPASAHHPPNGTAGKADSHRYDDGFVYPDAGTPLDGTTWWWGYERADQVRGDSLVFVAHGTSTESSTHATHQSIDRDANEDGIGPVLEMGADWHLNPAWTIGADFSFSWFDLDTRQQGALASLTQESVTHRSTEIDTFDLGGVIPPQPPYSGTFDGPGPVIDAAPERRTQAQVSQRLNARLVSEAETSLSADIWNFSLGPSLAWHPGRFSLRAGIALELDVISWKQATTEAASLHTAGRSRILREWTDTDSSTSVVPGIGLGASARWQITPHFDVTAFAKWRSMDALEFEFGRTQTSIDTSGFATGITLGFSF